MISWAGMLAIILVGGITTVVSVIYGAWLHLAAFWAIVALMYFVSKRKNEKRNRDE